MEPSLLNSLIIIVAGFALLSIAGWSRHPAIAATGAALFAVFAIVSMVALNVDGDFFGHLLPGFAMVRTAPLIFFGNGGPLVTSGYTTPLLGAVVFAGALIYQTVDIGAHTFSHKVHLFIYALCFTYMMSVAIGTRALKRAGPPRAGASPRLSPRVFLEPMIMVCLGILFYAHQHDKRPVPVVQHTVLSVLLCALGVAMMASTAVHTVLPAAAPAATLARGLHAFAWLLLGIWLCQMSLLFYIFRGKQGLWTLQLVPTVDGDNLVDGDNSRAEEEVFTYLAFDILLCGESANHDRPPVTHTRPFSTQTHPSPNASAPSANVRACDLSRRYEPPHPSRAPRCLSANTPLLPRKHARLIPLPALPSAISATLVVHYSNEQETESLLPPKDYSERSRLQPADTVEEV